MAMNQSTTANFEKAQEEYNSLRSVRLGKRMTDISFDVMYYCQSFVNAGLVVVLMCCPLVVVSGLQPLTTLFDAPTTGFANALLGLVFYFGASLSILSYVVYWATLTAKRLVSKVLLKKYKAAMEAAREQAEKAARESAKQLPAYSLPS